MPKVFTRALLFSLMVGVSGATGGCTTRDLGTVSSGVAPLGNNKFAIARNTLFEQTQWFLDGGGSGVGFTTNKVYFWKNQPPIVVDCSNNEAKECFAFEGR